MRNGVKHISSLRISFSEKNKKLLTLLVLLIVLFAAALAGICLGSVRLTPSEVFSALASGKSTPDGRIVYCIRLPRVLGSMLAGAALALSGAIIQAVLGNPLASPGVIGVNAGAGFFTVLCSALLPTAAKMLPAAAFVGAFAAVMTVYIIARKTEASKLTLVIAGAAISSLFNAGTDTVTELFPETLSGISSFKIGGIGNITLEKLFPAWIIIAVGIIAAFLLHNETDVLSLGDKTAFTLGLNVKVTRFVLLMIAAALAGAAVSFAGILGFVGLIVPHICGRLIGYESRYKMPACVLLGAAFVTVCDIAARTLFSPNEISLGIVISYIGVPFFIYLLLKKKGGKHNA